MRSNGERSEPFSTLDSEHPRLFLKAEGWDTLKARIEARDPQLFFSWEPILEEADKSLERTPLTREMEGRRLLGVSREALKRILCLAMAYRLTDDRRYLERAVAELDAVCSFDDWNPSHFLDVAEMATAVGIGYDWLHHDLTADQRLRYRTALLEKALNLGIRKESKQNWWIDGTNNWNQVCNGGLSVAALAIAGEGGGDVPEQIVIQAIENIGIAMQAYEPDGAYPEGPGYWDYGTTYNVTFLDALRSALGRDFGIADPYPGFGRSPEFRALMNTPGGGSFNFSDNLERRGPSPTLFWFDRPEITRLEVAYLKGETVSPKPRGTDRFGPVHLIWLSRTDPTAHGAPLPLTAIWDGGNPVAVFRSSHTGANASFVTLKGGAADISHGHMDAGSFIFESDGIRWGLDLPRGSYHHFESQDVGLWDNGQNGERWTLTGWSTRGHNLLRFPGYNPDVAGRCQWADKNRTAEPGVCVDLTALYPQFYDSYQRCVELRSDGSAVIVDRVKGMSAPVNPQWTLLTRADIEVDATGATLRQAGKTLRVEAECNRAFTIRWESADRPLRPEDISYPGVKRLIIEPMTRAGDLDLTVRLIPTE